MVKKPKYHIGIFIDTLTNSIENTISGDSFATKIHESTLKDIKGANKKNGWNFNWQAEFKTQDRKVYHLSIVDNPSIIQGLVSLTIFSDHVFVHLVESAPFNQGKSKLYVGVPGNLFAFACKLSHDNGNQGIIGFESKTKLIDHYEKTLGATFIGGQKMIIFPNSALKLINKYFKL